MFEWIGSLALAERLAVDADEAAQRTAMSRADDAAYHAAAVFVLDHGLVRDGQTHRAVWRTLIEDPAAERARVGRQGDRLKQDRVKADDRKPFPGDPRGRAQQAIARARDVVESRDRLG